MLCVNLEKQDGVSEGESSKGKGRYVYLWSIRVDVWQKPTKHCKAIYVQLKIIIQNTKTKTNNDNNHFICCKSSFR